MYQRDPDSPPEGGACREGTTDRGRPLRLTVPLAFIPMFFSAWANKEMNRADPDCGSSFTWAARALGPKTGWYAGGWGTIASDLLAMASQSQIAGQYFFLLIGVKSIGLNATSPWVLTVGIAWIVILTYICYRGIQVSARLQVTLLAVELFMLLLLAVVAIVRVGIGRAPAGHAAFSWSWLNPAHFASPSVFMAGMLLMVFIYWGWDTTTSINEETSDPHRIPGLAGVVSTLILLGTYFVVILSVQLFAGFGSSGIGLGNSNNVNDVLSPMGEAVFGSGPVGVVLSRLLLLMVLTSAAATTQTTILPTARTTLSMSFHKALPAIFGRVHPRYLTPWFSTIVFSVASAVMYVALNFVSGGNVLADSVTAATFFVALYLGSTGFACFWFYRRSLRASAANFWLRGVIPLLSGIMLLIIGGWAIYFYTDPNQSYSTWQMPFWPHCDDRGRALHRHHHRAGRPGLDAVPAPLPARVLLRRVHARRLLDHRRRPGGPRRRLRRRHRRSRLGQPGKKRRPGKALALLAVISLSRSLPVPETTGKSTLALWPPRRPPILPGILLSSRTSWGNRGGRRSPRSGVTCARRGTSESRTCCRSPSRRRPAATPTRRAGTSPPRCWRSARPPLPPASRSRSPAPPP